MKEFERDELDALLSGLPEQNPNDRIPERIRQNFRQRVKRQRRLRIALSGGLLGTGLLLTLPGLLAFKGDISIPFNSLGIIDSLITSLQDWQLSLDQSWNGITTFQGNLAASISITSWIGIAILGFGTLFCINFLIPHNYS